MALDSSTTSTKATVVDVDGNVWETARRGIRLHTPAMDQYEHNPIRWWEISRDTIAEMLSRLSPADRARIGAIGVTQQRESFAPFKADGTPLRHGILWLDGRATDQIRRYGTETSTSCPSAIRAPGPSPQGPWPEPGHRLAGPEEPETASAERPGDSAGRRDQTSKEHDNADFHRSGRGRHGHRAVQAVHRVGLGGAPVGHLARRPSAGRHRGRPAASSHQRVGGPRDQDLPLRPAGRRHGGRRRRRHRRHLGRAAEGHRDGPRHNLKAASFTQAVREMSILVEMAGGRAGTPYGLAGVGDLEVTGLVGRNKFYGVRLGGSETPDGALAEMERLEQTVEGHPAAPLAVEFAHQAGATAEDLPLLHTVARILEGGVDDVYGAVATAVKPVGS